MAASNLFGRGLAKKKLETILDKFPELLKKNISIEQIQTVEGIGKVSGNLFIDNLPKFREFYKQLPKKEIVEQTAAKENIVKQSNEEPKQMKKDMTGMYVLFTGVRDKEIHLAIENNNGKVESNFNKKVNLVIIKDSQTMSASAKKAVENNIELMTIDEFKKKYM
eukprot:325674-Hanusia_phi.AAC.1